MTNNFEMIINGRKIELPFDINEMFSQLDLGLQEATSQPVMPIVHPQHSVVRKIITCKDTAVRDVVIDINKRLIKIEELLKLRKKAPAKKVISKTKETPKTKGKSKEKSKTTKLKVKKKSKEELRIKEKSKVIKKKIGKKK